jgi:hypothetical protein
MKRLLTSAMLLSSVIAIATASAQEAADQPAIHGIPTVGGSNAFLCASAQETADQPAIHGMLMVGASAIYLSHLPMFHSPHEYQAIVQADLGEPGNSIYLEDRKNHPTENIYTLQPQEKFVLPAMIQNPRTFPANIYRGHFERGGTLIAESVPVSIAKVIYFKKFEMNAHKPAELYYILFGSSSEQFVAHLITAKPDFDQVLRVEVDDDQLRSAVASNLQHIQLEIAGMPDDKPVSDAEPLRAIALQDVGKRALILNNPHQYYLEFGDLSH